MVFVEPGARTHACGHILILRCYVGDGGVDRAAGVDLERTEAGAWIAACAAAVHLVTAGTCVDAVSLGIRHCKAVRVIGATAERVSSRIIEFSDRKLRCGPETLIHRGCCWVLCQWTCAVRDDIRAVLHGIWGYRLHVGGGIFDTGVGCLLVVSAAGNEGKQKK